MTMEPFYQLCSNVVYMAVIAGAIWFGYWMGRNSSDKPLRSEENPAKTPKNVMPIDEPEEDVFNDALKEPINPGERLATIKTEP